MGSSQPFIPVLKDIVPPSRSLSSSIWAPQPHPTEASWQQAITSFSQNAEEDKARVRPDDRRGPTFGESARDEDVFGPIDFLRVDHKKDVGAIGDGRKKASPDTVNNHIEQLLRVLDLNSPIPFAHPPPPGLHNSTSPDLSPISATSSLLTPTDSPARTSCLKIDMPYDCHPSVPSPQGLQLQTETYRPQDIFPAQLPRFPPPHISHPYQAQDDFPFYESFPQKLSLPSAFSPPVTNLMHVGERRASQDLPWFSDRMQPSADWLRPEDCVREYSSGLVAEENNIPPQKAISSSPQGSQGPQPINFLSLLHPSSSPPYHLFVSRIIKSSDQQASIFLQQKLKIADSSERAKIIDAICARGFEMMAHRFGNWAVQRCLEAASTIDERRKIVQCMRGRIVELACNCYGCHVLQKALDCEEEVRLLIVSELLLGDPAQTLVNKHASHVWSKIMELTWTPPAPPIFTYVNKSLKGKWASLACHETGSLVVQHAFENLEESAKDGIVEELLNQGPVVFGEVAKNQWGSYCIQHILEHGSAKHRQMALDHLVAGLLEFATNEQGSKSVTKALKEGGKETLDRFVKRMAESTKGGRRAIIVDLALSVTGSQLIASVLPNVDKDQRTLLYESIRGHIVTLRGCKTGSKVIWLL
ncbi:ARM repeat-containing protein [Multifurca ochricompacta]|uniref:ARM repeat-containing protein n=1 Tax=Multifurca ochricompacta TaxID=376703 RepID=A0AAD4QUK5_9AGAM|nr:ARM repeat-containing protein [Multifurca ochricompacta]